MVLIFDSKMDLFFTHNSKRNNLLQLMFVTRYLIGCLAIISYLYMLLGNKNIVKEMEVFFFFCKK